MYNLELTKIGNVPVIIDTETNTKTSFKGGYQDVVKYVNRFKLADCVKGLHEMPVYFFNQLEPRPQPDFNFIEAHAVQLTNGALD
jgi:hypothetical protein